MSHQVDPIQRKFSDLIFHIRTSRKITQAVIAEKVNISKRCYQRIEKGEVKPSSAVTLRIMAFLEIDSKYLQEGAELPTEEQEEIA